MEPQSPLAKSIRQKYPGQYDDMNDADLEKAVLAKYPEYADLAKKEEPSLLSKLWTKATTPIVDVSPEMKQAQEEYTKEHPILGGGMQFLTSGVTGMATPLNLAFMGTGLGEMAGLGKIASATRRGLSALVTGEGAQNVISGEHPILGGLEVAGGLAGMRGPKPKVDVSALPRGANTRVTVGGQEIAPAPTTLGPGDVLRQRLALLKPLNEIQAQVYERERAERFAKARDVGITGTESAHKFMGQLAGEHTKVTMEPLTPDAATLESWHKMIGEHFKSNPKIGVPESAQAIDALERMMRGSVPVPSQVDVLEEIFGKGIKEALADKTSIKPEIGPIRQAYDLSRSLMAVDPPFITSAAFRQGLPYIGTGDWFRAWWKSAKAFGSQTSFEGTMAKINEHPLFKKTINPLTNKLEPSYADKIGVRLSSMGEVRPREEMIRGNLAERIPIIGGYVKSSNRAYTAFLNDLRVNRTARLYDVAKSNGLDPEHNLVLGGHIADVVNDLTGAGKLETGIGNYQVNLERHTKLLTDTLFAPRLIASRIRMLNPSTYVTAGPVARREYIGGLLRTVAGWWGMAELAELNGAQVSKDPNSADFGKPRWGNTRIDPGGGLQQYLVLAHRLLPTFMGGENILVLYLVRLISLVKAINLKLGLAPQQTS